MNSFVRDQGWSGWRFAFAEPSIRDSLSRLLFVVKLIIVVMVGCAVIPPLQGAQTAEQGVLEKEALWWSLAPLKRPGIPRLSEKDARWVRTPIDAFIMAKLRENGLSPSPEEDRQSLVRRLYYDLIGLPPSPLEVRSFVTDTEPKAYERLVDRLLNSPRYGEKWARHWLDVVHYGDTHGYDKDKLRLNAWPYRDYVIRAFNSDKPYSRFVSEQIAGDVLFPGSPDGIIATGFIAAGPWDFVAQAEVPETKIDGKIARHLDRDDMVATTMNTFVSMTVQCARCHNHKFDPISQEDYYSLQAVFAALDRADRPYDLDPKVIEKRRMLVSRRNDLSADKAAVQAKIGELGGEELVELDERIKKSRESLSSSVRPEFGYHSQIESNQNLSKWVQVDLVDSVQIDRMVFVASHDDFNGIGAGFGFPVRFKIEISDDEHFTDGVKVVLDHTNADYTNPQANRQTVQLSGARARFVRITATKLAPRKNDYIFALAELSVFDLKGKNVALEAEVSALDSIEAPPRWQKQNLVDGIHHGTKKTEGSGELARLTDKRRELLDRVAGGSLQSEQAEINDELKRVADNIAKLPKGNLVYAGTVHFGSGNFRGTGADGGKPREIHVLHRGNILTPGAVVGPGTLSAIEGLPSRFDECSEGPEGERRKELARWITDPKNPLTWRSIVNRVWAHHFGRGIVDSPNDFGRMGRLPTHPKLLDWLAVEFRDGGQSLKQVHRLLVNSATYRQSSKSDVSLVNLDSGNQYLWRMNRRRLDAEAIRDSVLLVSNALDQKMYGPGFQDFVIEKPEHSPHYEYHLHNAEDPRAHRRSVYRFLVRSQPQPFMATLDCADPSMQVDKRTETYTALQSLALLNNKLMIAMAKRFAARLSQVDGDLADQVTAGFRIVTGREPGNRERAVLIEYSQNHGLPNLCRVLFNLNEFVFVD